MRERNRRIILAAGAGLVQRAAQLLTALITLPLALHVLGVAGFGIWGAATSVVWLSGMLDLGLGSALVTLLPRAISAGRHEDARLHIKAALVGGCALAMALLALGAAFCLLRAPSAPFIIAGLGLALNIPLSIAGNIWFGLQKGYVTGFWELVQTFVTLALLLLAALNGGVATMVAAVYGGTLIANAASLAHLLRSQPAIRPRDWRVSLASLRDVIAPGSLLFAITVAGICAYVFDTLLALSWLGPVAAAQMTVGLRICTTATGFLAVTTQPLWPAFVEAASLDDRAWEWRTLRNGTLAVTALALLGSAAIIIFGPAALKFWLHDGLRIPVGLFWAMAAWIVALSVPRVASLLFNAVSILRFQIWVAAAAAAFAFGLKYIAAPDLGVTGILAATPAAWLLVIWPCFAWRARGWIVRPEHITVY
jgi:O-antigen/teichoic acid export membrane protein